MDEISEVAMDILISELRSFAADYGFRTFFTSELDPVDPDCRFSVTLTSESMEWTAKFFGRTFTASLRGSLDYIKMFTSQR